ncbi:MAG: hypothetical protein ACUVQ9_12895 [Thermodesulfobacteriota bacterium]
MEYLRSVLVMRERIVGNSRVSYDLPVNPLSHLNLTIRFKNSDNTNRYDFFNGLFGLLDQVSVLYRGANIVSLSGQELFVASQIVTGLPVGQTYMRSTPNASRSITLTIPFGRKLFNPVECLPALKRGELQIIIDWGYFSDSMVNPDFTIETFELLGATPSRFLRMTSQAGNPTTTGPFDIDLPIGNPILGILIRSTHVPGEPLVGTIDSLSLLVDNSQQFISSATWESLHGDFCKKFPSTIFNVEHTHLYNPEETQIKHTQIQELESSYFDKWSYLDFDPEYGDNFMFQTAGHARIHLKVEIGMVSNFSVIPIEMMLIPQTQTATA